MWETFSHVEPVGLLRIVEIYVYYDGPRLFACKNASGQTFVAVWTEDAPAHDSWLLLAVSWARFRMLRSGRIDLRGAFADPEDGFVFRLRTEKRTGIASASPVSSALLDADELPDAGQFLEVHCDEASRSDTLAVGSMSKFTQLGTFNLPTALVSDYARSAFVFLGQPTGERLDLAVPSAFGTGLGLVPQTATRSGIKAATKFKIYWEHGSLAPVRGRTESVLKSRVEAQRRQFGRGHAPLISNQLLKRTHGRTKSTFHANTAVR
jgi:hypothetical protein